MAMTRTTAEVSSPSAVWSARRPGTGLLVVGHGTADVVGAEETRTIARQAAALLEGVPVELGFLEVIGPSIDDACAALAARGCTAAVAAPLLLFTAGHARRDVPEALVAAAERHRLAIAQSAAFGCHPRIVELSRLRRRQALAACGPVAEADTAVVMIGRGSSAEDAVAQLRMFIAAAYGDRADHGAGVEVGFVAAARPTVEEALDSAASRGPRRVIVQPHLLFRGHVEEQVAKAVARAHAAHPHCEWVVVPRLGADPLVAEAVLDLATQALDEAFAVPGATFWAGKNVSQETA